MSDNQTVSQELLETIQELQQLSSLSGFGLAGGTNLAVHSDDQLIIQFGKSYRTAKLSWRKKVRDYMSKNGFELPPIKPIN
jgi:hypothetical protein